MPIAYTIIAMIEDPGVQAEYLRWLREGHMQEVIDGGAMTGEIVVGDGGTRITTRYVFPSRDAFHRYESGAAPALRADGMRRFGPESGKSVRFERDLGEITDVMNGTP